MAFCSFNSFNRISNKPKKVSTTTAFQTLLVSKPPWGRYTNKHKKYIEKQKNNN